MDNRPCQSLRTGLALMLLVGALVACGKRQQTDDATTQSNEPAEQIGQTVEPAAGQELEQPGDSKAAADKGDTPVGFDLDSIPISTAPLGEFPYFSVPEGYREDSRNARRLDFAQVAFWTGDRFETVEGKVYATGIRVKSDSDKQFSALEVVRNLEHVVTSAGGVQVADGQVPREARKDKAIEALMREYHTEAKCWAHDPMQTFVLRRTDRTIWVRTCKSQRFAGLIVAETQPFVPTSKLLPAETLKQKLEADGRVALQVNFATDKADILPGSQPQIAQVLQLLQQDPALKLSVDGHTDDTGGAAHNQALSEARARAVVAALAAEGIDPARLQAQGFGQDAPVADNATEQGRAQNRRVELVRI
ncbi:OmpA family protein [Luteimonas salinilitoris]|uniref:OmpA family protein n=1 Tax=Luteimonas salinilitoris TaxID=3237697 RepID=A0ABV4HMX4_9GAMM